MAISELKFIKRCAEFIPRTEIRNLPARTRGIYALLCERPQLKKYDVIYIGMARGLKTGIAGRLRSHARSARKNELWTHFSVFEVWDNISEDEVAELEGLYAKSSFESGRSPLEQSFEGLMTKEPLLNSALHSRCPQSRSGAMAVVIRTSPRGNFR